MGASPIGDPLFSDVLLFVVDVAFLLLVRYAGPNLVFAFRPGTFNSTFLLKLRQKLCR